MNTPDKIIATVETRLQSDFRIKGFKSIQTSHGSKGGCMIATNIERQKNIKTIFGNLAWMSVVLKNVPVHVITCYVHNGTGKEAI